MNHHKMIDIFPTLVKIILLSFGLIVSINLYRFQKHHFFEFLQVTLNSEGRILLDKTHLVNMSQEPFFKDTYLYPLLR